MTDDDLRRWREVVYPRAVAKVPERPNLTRSGGEPVAPLYTDRDLPPVDAIGLPGEFPYTRGVQPTMYRASLWTMRQYAGFGTARQSNERYRYLLSQGTTGLSVAFDLPTQMGYDSDAPMARGEVGRVGVAIDSIAEMRTLLDGLPLDRVSTSMTINATASTLIALYAAVATERGVPLDRLRGTIQNDVLKEYIARGTYIYPPRQSMRIVTDLFRWCAATVPQWNTISISGYHIREAGSTAAQELAFTLADGIAYVEAAIAAGLAVDAFAPRLSFFFNAHNQLLEEVGKFRAARRMWARIMRDRFGAKDPRSLTLRFHTQTAGSTLTAQQIDVNVVRVTIQALAAVLGGTQSLHTNGRDEALSLPTADSALLALRTQQVIGHESGVAGYVDPLGGAYAVEAVTDELEAEATRLIAEIDAMGGMVAAIEAGFPQREIQTAAYGTQLAIERGDQVVVGVNKFVDGAAHAGAGLRLDEAIEAEQIAAVRAHRAARDAIRARDAVDAVQQAAAGTDNLMPTIFAAVQAGATLGEIADALRRVFGEYRERPVV
ncbi:MAG: methylmalonyl-CoA mutase family protein [Myxococcota bacterium]